ncbi:nucleoside 2-deoxyribosyltransferase domain-containing protein [Streptomyces sp. NPDC094031]|uniref:nucleoside 2-deoxyribosyltransferase domain-containing protein n=1 Tax=Streptomyces sp. NPDC094031 TaxID=3155307 RepID=UPI0033203295
MTDCAFCDIATGRAPAVIVRQWPDAIAIRPRSGGVHPGHLLVIPRRHIADAGADLDSAAAAQRRASELVAELPAANIITSKGAAATQTVFHAHWHVLPREALDGLLLPWTAQQDARRAADPSASTDTRSGINLVMAREPIPAGPSVFLAGPTPDKSAPVPSWRPEAARLLAEQWAGEQPLTVLSPESRNGERADRYETQVDWETAARDAATAVLFWIPRDMRTLPGMTSNVEFGLDAPSGRAVLGCPPDCPNPERNRYLIHVAYRHAVPVCTTLAKTVAASLALIATAGAPAVR